MLGARQLTSILSMSIPLYCFFISLLAIFIASTVAICSVSHVFGKGRMGGLAVFFRFSVVIAACSMFHVCCCSCINWFSYILFCFNVLKARC